MVVMVVVDVVAVVVVAVAAALTEVPKMYLIAESDFFEQVARACPGSYNKCMMIPTQGARNACVRRVGVLI